MWDWGRNYDKSMTVKEQLHVTIPALYQPLPAPSADSIIIIICAYTHVRFVHEKRWKWAGETSQHIVTEFFSWTEGQKWTCQ